MTLDEALKACPIIAILRGIKPSEVEAVADTLVDIGIRCIEVPLNSPEPLDSIDRLVRRFGGSALIGAGTVLSVQDVEAVAGVGGQLIVSPNLRGDVVAATKNRDMVSCPGVFSPTEMFEALDHGADGLKMFPTSELSPGYVSAMTSVLPVGTRLLAVGGVSPENAQEWLTAGCVGLGVGSSLYKPGQALAEIRKNGQSFVQACEEGSSTWRG